MYSFKDIKFKIMKQGGIFGILDCKKYCIFVAMNIYSRGGNQGLWEIVVFPDKVTKKPMKLKCFPDSTYAGKLNFVEVEEYLIKIQEELR